MSRWVPGGGQTVAWARIVKKAANSALKNITSEPSQMMTPTASIGGRSGRMPLVVTPRVLGGDGLGHGVLLSRPAPPGANILVAAPTSTLATRWIR